MPKLHSKQKVLGGRAQVISYERDPSTFYYRELIAGTTRYKTKRLQATTAEAAQLEAVDAYAALRGVEEPKPQVVTPTVRTAKAIKVVVRNYLSELADKVTTGLIKQTTYDVAESVIFKLVVPYCEETGIKTVNDIKVDTWKKYMAWRQETATGRWNKQMKGDKLTKLTLQKESSQIKKWVSHYLLPHRLISAELASTKDFVPYPKINHEDLLANPAINPDDWLMILDYVRKEWIKPVKPEREGRGVAPKTLARGVWSRNMFWNWILICKNTGARPEELLKLKWKDVEFEDVGRTDSKGDEVSKEIAHVVLRSSKTKAMRISSCNCVYVFERWLDYQKEFAKTYDYPWDITPNDYVWAPPYNQKKVMSYSWYQTLWSEIRDALSHKFRGHVFSDEPYTIYSLRSTFIEDCLIQGKDIFLVAKAAGHDVKTLQKHYERIDPRKRSREMTEFQYGSMPKTKRRSSV